jgi:hypothetical protein
VNTQRQESRLRINAFISACLVPGVRNPDGGDGGELPDDELEERGDRERARAADVGEGDLGRPGGVVEDAVGRGGELCVDDSVDVLEGGAYRAAAMAAIAAVSSRSLLVLIERGSPDLSLGGVRVVDVRG